MLLFAIIYVIVYGMIHTKMFKAHCFADRCARNSPGMTFEDALGCLRECVALFKGEMSGVEFYGKTGHQPHVLRRKT